MPRRLCAYRFCTCACRAWSICRRWRAGSFRAAPPAQPKKPRCVPGPFLHLQDPAAARARDVSGARGAGGAQRVAPHEGGSLVAAWGSCARAKAKRASLGPSAAASAAAARVPDARWAPASPPRSPISAVYYATFLVHFSSLTLTRPLAEPALLPRASEKMSGCAPECLSAAPCGNGHPCPFAARARCLPAALRAQRTCALASHHLRPHRMAHRSPVLGGSIRCGSASYGGSVLSLATLVLLLATPAQCVAPTGGVCPTGYALTALDSSQLCQTFECNGQNDAYYNLTCGVLGDLYYATNAVWSFGTAALTSGTAPDLCSNPSIGSCSSGAMTNLVVTAQFTGGTIPASLGLLTRLTYVSLDSNQLTGTIPSSLASLTALTTLDLRGNALSGALSPALYLLCVPTATNCLFRLPGNTLLTLPSLGAVISAVAGTTSLSSLSITRTFSLAWLPGTLPASIGSLTALTYLSLSNGQLNGTIPASLGGLTALTWLDLSSNQLSGPIPATLPPSCTNMFLNGNNLTGSIPLALLATLLSGATRNWNFACPGLTSDFSVLASLPASTTRVQTGGTVAGVSWNAGGLPDLTSLSIVSSPLNGTVPAFLASMSALSVINLAGNSLSGTIPPALLQKCMAMYSLGTCDFSLQTGAGLSLPPSAGGGSSDFAGLQLSITNLQATVAAQAPLLASLAATVAALSVNISQAAQTCSAAV